MSTYPSGASIKALDPKWRRVKASPTPRMSTRIALLF
jgi:hypothetical protein